MKSKILLISFFLFLAGGSGHAEPIPIASNVYLDGKILVVDAPGSRGVKFSVLWKSWNGPTYSVPDISRGKNSLYDMRKIPSWSGKAELVAIDGVRPLGVSIKVPDFMDEIKIFLSSEPWTPRSVNFLFGHSLFTLGWEKFLLLIFFLSTVIILSLKRRFYISLTLGFLVAWSFMSARTLWDDLGFLRHADETRSVVITNNVKKNVATIATDFIKEGKWSAGELLGYLKIITYYELAEIPFSAATEEQSQTWRILSQDGNLVLEPPEDQRKEP